METLTNTDTSKWHNTGGNGPASATWVRRSGPNMAACVEVMPHRVLVTMYVGNDVDEDHEGIPFPRLDVAQAWADAYMARQASKHPAGYGATGTATLGEVKPDAE